MDLHDVGMTWMLKKVLAASGYPYTQYSMQVLYELGIRHFVSLCEYCDYSIPSDRDFTDVRYSHIPVQDWMAPSIQQADEFVMLVDESRKEKRPVLAHCAQGKGRTGTLIACYFVATEHMSADAAISHVRNLRPGSIQTSAQEDFVSVYASYLKKARKRKCVVL